MSSKSRRQPWRELAWKGGDGKAQLNPPGSAVAPSGITDIQEAAWK